ncbi:unnamed protein product [Prunus armeniaca]|uniref:Tf2-1-like SH3-like domain-containing protein n=1 Tax=Prunus armeniaca TaxID=36596 RepID=A0A6J5V5F1_PRUAR|nr:unnamed protein product [Prunus armeniaca]
MVQNLKASTLRTDWRKAMASALVERFEGWAVFRSGRWPSQIPLSFHILPKFYGPYEILDKVGLVAYKLKLPPTSKLHLVFHVSCLKKHLGPAVSPSLSLPVITDEGILQDHYLAILERRLVKKGNAACTQVLVLWQHHTKEEATWEDYDNFFVRFHDFHP